MFCSHSQICSERAQNKEPPAQWGFLLLLLGMTSLWIIFFSYLVLNQWTEIGISCTMSFFTDRQLSQAHMLNESHIHYCCCVGSVGSLLWQPLGHLHRGLLLCTLCKSSKCDNYLWKTCRGSKLPQPWVHYLSLSVVCQRLVTVWEQRLFGVCMYSGVCVCGGGM